MKVETRFHDTYATFTHDWGLTVTLEGRPEWVEKALDAVRAAMGKIDRASEAPH